MPPKEKVLFLPSEYLTVGLVALFVVSIFIGVLIISAKTSPESSISSIPLASGPSVLSAQTNTTQEVPKIIPPQPPAGPILPSIKPKASSTPKPSVTPSPSPSLTPSPTATPADTPTPTPSPTASPSPTDSPSPSPTPTP